MTVTEITEKVQSFIESKITSMAVDSPMIGIFKPLFMRGINNNLYKLQNGLQFIADKNGNIDVDSLVTEITESIISSKPFTINTTFLGPIELGGGTIKMGLPFTSKQIVLTSQDLQDFKSIFTK